MKPHLRRIVEGFWCCGDRAAVSAWRSESPGGMKSMRLAEQLSFGHSPAKAFAVWKGKQ